MRRTEPVRVPLIDLVTRPVLTLAKYSAVVTSCSHIYCVECANSFFGTSRPVCPACKTELTEMDDLVEANLRPSDTWKTTILAGLAPSVIIDIAGRAINFHVYQQYQDRSYQDLLNKEATEVSGQEYLDLAAYPTAFVVRKRNAYLEKAVIETEQRAQAEVERLSIDLAAEQKRARDLQDMHRSNTKAYSKLKEQHERLKRRVVTRSTASTRDHLDIHRDAAYTPASASASIVAPAPSPASTARRPFVANPTSMRSQRSTSQIPTGFPTNSSNGTGSTKSFFSKPLVQKRLTA
ncbi:RING finger protein [Sporobolomyces koalae]|uniref:RING finger protein n=1 Tax=Sporobolomyces koalae TaxID=500713 RepID=UPI00317AD639